MGYLFATLLESWLHRNVGHASPSARRKWARLNWFGTRLCKAHFGHAVLHHGKTFRANHVTQFRSSGEKQLLDAELIDARNETFIRLHYGLVTNLIGSVYYMAIPGLICVVSSFVIFSRAELLFLLGACFPIVSTPMLSNLIHPYLHLPIRVANETSPFLIRWLLRSPYGDWARKHHYVHHRYPRVNFNLLPGGDYLFGTFRKPTGEEIGDMKRIGLLMSDSKDDRAV